MRRRRKKKPKVENDSIFLFHLRFVEFFVNSEKLSHVWHKKICIDIWNMFQSCHKRPLDDIGIKWPNSVSLTHSNLLIRRIS